MKSFKVDISEPALENIMDLRAYIAKKLRNPDAASKQSDRILSAIDALAVFPEVYRVRKYDSKGNALRYFPVDNYVIIYSIDDEKSIVHVLNVLYSRRNIDALI